MTSRSHGSKMNRLLVSIAIVLGCVGPSTAQPAPTFRVVCGDLRQAIDSHDLEREFLTVIAVEGEVLEIHKESGLTYVLICEPPDPFVLCVTYDTNGNVSGDRVVVAGAYSRPGIDHVMLDPCLHSNAPGDGG